MIGLATRRAGRSIEAEVSPLGASLRRLAVEGVELVRNALDDETPPKSAGVILVPWPNRIADARWQHDGVVHRLEVTEPALGHALHGLLADRRYEVAARDAQSVVMAAAIDPKPGYPFRLDTSVSYVLAPTGIVVTHRLVNRGTTRAPVALGAHPYLRLGDRAVGELVVTTSARRALHLDARHIPFGEFCVEGTPYDLRAGRRVRDIPPHGSYTALERAGDRSAFVHRLADPTAGDAVVLEAGPEFAWMQAYVTDAFPGAAAGELAVAIEPMTAPPDAFNSGEGVRWLEPGDIWQARWGIRYEVSPVG
jgi:aldose 1-epimerase